MPPHHPQRPGGMSVAIPVPQSQRISADGMQLHNASRIPQYYYQASNFNQISKTATNLLNDNKQHQYIFVQPSTAGPYFKFPPPPAPPPYPKPPVVPPYPKQNEPLPRVPLSKPSTPTQHLYETIPDKPPIPRPRESQAPSNRTQKKRAPSSGHHHNSQSNMSHQRKHMSMNEQQQLQLHLQHHHHQQQQQQQLQRPIVSNISSGIQYNNEQRTSADGGVAQPHYSYGKQQQHQLQQQHHHRNHNHNEKGLQPLPPSMEKDMREMPVGSAGELYDTRYIEEKIKESLLDNNNSRLPILYEEADAGAHHQNDGSRILVTKYAYRNSQIDFMAETAQAVAAASYYASR